MLQAKVKGKAEKSSKPNLALFSFADCTTCAFVGVTEHSGSKASPAKFAVLKYDFFST